MFSGAERKKHGGQRERTKLFRQCECQLEHQVTQSCLIICNRGGVFQSEKTLNTNGQRIIRVWISIKFLEAKSLLCFKIGKRAESTWYATAITNKRSCESSKFWASLERSFVALFTLSMKSSKGIPNFPKAYIARWWPSTFAGTLVELLRTLSKKGMTSPVTLERL